MSLSSLVPSSLRGWAETVGAVVLILLGVSHCVERDNRLRAEGQVENLTESLERTTETLVGMKDSLDLQVEATLASDSLARIRRDSIHNLRFRLFREASAAGESFDVAADSLGGLLDTLAAQAPVVVERPLAATMVRLHHDEVVEHDTQVAALLEANAEADSIAASWKAEAGRWKANFSDQSAINDTLRSAFARQEELTELWKDEATDFELGQFGLQFGGGVLVAGAACILVICK